MKLRLILVALLVTTSAFAEDAVPSPAPSPSPAPVASPAPPTKFYLEVEPADLSAISEALLGLPKRVADPLILKLNGQLQAQQPIQEAAEKAKESRKRK